MTDVIKIVNGYLEENCYVLHNGVDSIIVDPGSEGDRIIECIKKNNLNVLAILITHSHFDHVGALKEVTHEFGNAKVIDFKSDKKQKVGPFEFQIIENFGHTDDSVSFYFEKNDIIFTGDFLFKGTIGNFPEDNEDKMFNSLKIVKYLSTNIVVYPGHGDSTTIGDELKTNIFLRGM